MLTLQDTMAVRNFTDVETAQEEPAKQDGLPLWKLVLSALPWVGLQAIYSTEFAVTTPYLQDLGMSGALASLSWFWGPLTGFITAPLVGSLSDSCQSRFGRRRPFILGGLVVLWAASLLFASSKHLFPKPYSMWFAWFMFMVLDVTINVIQTPVRAIVSDLSSEEQQSQGQFLSAMFAGLGNLVGSSVMKLWAVPYEAIFQVMLVCLGINTVLILVQTCLCKETPYTRDPSAPKQSLLAPFVNTFRALTHMPAELMKIGFVQFFSWFALMCYLPNTSTWFGVNVYGGSADAPEDSQLKQLYQEGQDANSTAGMANALATILCSMLLIGAMLKTQLPIRYVYAFCLFGGALAMMLPKIAVGHSVGLAILVCALVAIPYSAIFSFPFSIVGAMNKRAQEAGQEVETGLQMGVLNLFICTPQFVVTFAVGGVRSWLGREAMPWVLLIGGVSFAIAGVGALTLKGDEATTKSADC